MDIAQQAGYAIDQNDLDALKFGVNIWQKSSTELRSFLQSISQRPELQARLQSPNNDPAQIAAELGINLDDTDVSTLRHLFAPAEIIELDDEALSQVTGGVVLEAAATGMFLTFVVPMIEVAVIAAAAVTVTAAVAGTAVIGGAIYSAVKN